MSLCIPCGCDETLGIQMRTKATYGLRGLCYVAQDGDDYYGSSTVSTERTVLEAFTRTVKETCTVTSTITATHTHCDFTLEDPPPPCCEEPEPDVTEPCGEDLLPCDVAPIEQDCNQAGDQETTLGDLRGAPGAPAMVDLGDWTEWEDVVTINKSQFRGPDLAAPVSGGPSATIDAFVNAGPESNERGRRVVEARLKPGAMRAPVKVRFHLETTPEGGGSPSTSTADILIPADGSAVLFEPPFPTGNADVLVTAIEYFAPGEL